MKESGVLGFCLAVDKRVQRAVPFGTDGTVACAVCGQRGQMRWSVGGRGVCGRRCLVTACYEAEAVLLSRRVASRR